MAGPGRGAGDSAWVRGPGGAGRRPLDAAPGRPAARDIQNFLELGQRMAFCALIHKFFPDALTMSGAGPAQRGLRLVPPRAFHRRVSWLGRERAGTRAGAGEGRVRPSPRAAAP